MIATITTLDGKIIAKEVEVVLRFPGDRWAGEYQVAAGTGTHSFGLLYLLSTTDGWSGEIQIFNDRTLLVQGSLATTTVQFDGVGQFVPPSG